MKRVLSLVVTGVAVFSLSGCSGGDGGIYKDYYITDIGGAGVEDILWSCDSGTSGITDASGNFYTDGAADSCDFDFDTWGITGNIYLEDDISSLEGVFYNCEDSTNFTIHYTGTTQAGGLIGNASNFRSCELIDLP